MKGLLKITALALIIISCSKPEIKPIGEYYPAGDGMIGSWTLTSVTLTDLDLPVPETDDPSDFYNSYATHWNFSFNADSTYTVDEKGPGPDTFGDSGTWTFTNYPFPESVMMYGTDTTTLTLKNMPRASDFKFGFEFTRNGCGGDYVTYEYTLTRN